MSRLGQLQQTCMYEQFRNALTEPRPRGGQIIAHRRHPPAGKVADRANSLIGQVRRAPSARTTVAVKKWRATSVRARVGPVTPPTGPSPLDDRAGRMIGRIATVRVDSSSFNENASSWRSQMGKQRRRQASGYVQQCSNWRQVPRIFRLHGYPASTGLHVSSRTRFRSIDTALQWGSVDHVSKSRRALQPRPRPPWGPGRGKY
uniref:Uncharacterized protein n=1 Tax=Trichuris muris TaxID=70415 RepID=A0A5S6Q891_TRIMR